mmetsp:Transcript_71853/g.208198  ORF Transcript_71853/g.208198 Transcript_71853/m.208198 type:complete len:106 (+) Transcript_71853:360-677(+)
MRIRVSALRCNVDDNGDLTLKFGELDKISMNIICTEIKEGADAFKFFGVSQSLLCYPVTGRGTVRLHVAWVFIAFTTFRPKFAIIMAICIDRFSWSQQATSKTGY